MKSYFIFHTNRESQTRLRRASRDYAPMESDCMDVPAFPADFDYTATLKEPRSTSYNLEKIFTWSQNGVCVKGCWLTIPGILANTLAPIYKKCEGQARSTSIGDVVVTVEAIGRFFDIATTTTKAHYVDAMGFKEFELSPKQLEDIKQSLEAAELTQAEA